MAIGVALLAPTAGAAKSSLAEDFIQKCKALPPNGQVTLDIVDERLLTVGKVVACLTGKTVTFGDPLKSLKKERLTMLGTARYTAPEVLEAFVNLVELKGFTVKQQGNFVHIARGPRGVPCEAQTKMPIEQGVREVGANHYQLERKMLDEQFADLTQLARQARVIPHYRDGRPQGYKLIGIRAKSLYSHIGLRSGDLIKRINGTAINSPNDALSLFEKLKSSDTVSLEVERAGQPVMLEYTIK